MSQARIYRMLDDVRITDYGKLMVLTLAAALAATVLVFTSMTSTELTAGEADAPGRASEGFVYFPGLHVNQATESTEHVQAF